MPFVHRQAAKSPLKEMACHTQPCVDVAAISPMGFAHSTGEPLIVRGNENQMNMVGHQTVRPHLNTIRLTRLSQPILIERVNRRLVETPAGGGFHAMSRGEENRVP